MENSTRCQPLLFFILCCLVTADVFAGHEQYRLSCRGDSVLGRKSICIGDQYSTPQAGFSIKESSVRVHFRYENMLPPPTAGTIQWKLTYQITLFSAAGDSTVRTSQTIEVGYSDTGRYTDKAVNNYNNCLKARLKVIQLEVTTVQGGTSHSNTYTPGGNFSPPGDLILELEVDLERYYRFNPSPPAVYIPTLPISIYRGCVEAEVITHTILPLAWDYVQGAESYELEWLFIDCTDTLLSTARSTLEFDFRNATSVSTTAQHYDIPMAYPHGLLLFRVRSIGVDISDNYTRMEGNWSIPLSKGEVREAPQQYVFRYCGLEAGKTR